MQPSAKPKVQFTWASLTKAARHQLAKYGLAGVYEERLGYEIAEVEKQGSTAYWVDLLNDRKRFDSNPNKLLLPWVLGMMVVPDGDSPKGYRRPTHEEWEAMDPVGRRDVAKDGPVLTSSHYKVIKSVLDSEGKLPSDIKLDSDKPDIDLDCLPIARDGIKQYAADRYNQGAMDGAEKPYGYVCSVGTWQTYLFRQALIDVWKALDNDNKDAILGITTDLPDDVDELKEGGRSTCKNKIRNEAGEEIECKTAHASTVCPKCGSDATDGPTLAKLLAEHEKLRVFGENNPQVMEYAVGLVGRIKTMGMHAGAIIISDRPLYGNLPLSLRGSTKKDKSVAGEKQWVSMWTEGRNTQLSKFGYIKWDILGLKNLQYIKRCCELVCENRGISFGDNLEGWDDIDPVERRAGWYKRKVALEGGGYGDWIRDEDGEPTKFPIPLDDEAALSLANQSKTDAVFQFDTPLAKQILGNGVRNFGDLMLFNAMGHPGPMDCIAPHSNVLTKRGLVPVCKLDPSRHEIAYLSERGPAYTNKFFPAKTENKQMFKITTASGKELTLSANHRVLTKNGYVRVADLTVDDEIVEFNHSNDDANGR